MITFKCYKPNHKEPQQETLDETAESPLWDLYKNYREDGLQNSMVSMTVRPVTSFHLDAPHTVDGITEYLKSNGYTKIIDPLAGTGYWSMRLSKKGFDVTATDLFDLASNTYHRTGHQWFPVQYGLDAVEIIPDYPRHALLLSWPPYDEPLGCNILKAYKGDCVVYFGETRGGCCGDDTMFDLLDAEWDLVENVPTQNWFGIHARTHIYLRKPSL